jgi:hypothetical protein
MAQQQPNDERYMKEEMIVVAMDLGTTNSESNVIMEIILLTVPRRGQLLISVSRDGSCRSNGNSTLNDIHLLDITHHLYNR